MPVLSIEKPDRKTLERMGVFRWPVWEKEKSRFDWFYDSKEVCYILQGRVKVTPDNGAPVEFGAGDLVTFPKGLKCVWEIFEDVRKHYQFTD